MGDNADIATDFHGRATPMISKILCKGLEPYYPMFVEEAMWGQDGAEGTEAWRELSDSTTVPLATGERKARPLGCGPRARPAALSDAAVMRRAVRALAVPRHDRVPGRAGGAA